MPGYELVPYQQSSPSRTRRALSREVEQVRTQALLRAAQVQAAGFVGTVAVHEVAALAALEEELARQSPLAGHRVGMIVDAACLTIASEIRGMRWQ